MLNTWTVVPKLDRMFDDVMGSAFGAATGNLTFNPAIDVRASDTEVALVCDVPGVRQEDLEITLANRVLTIKESVASRAVRPSRSCSGAATVPLAVRMRSPMRWMMRSLRRTWPTVCSPSESRNFRRPSRERFKSV